MPVVSVIIKTLTAFSNGEVIIITTGCPYIKKVSPSLSSTNSFAVNTFHFLVVILVRHSSCFFSLKIYFTFYEVTNILMFLKQPKESAF